MTAQDKKPASPKVDKLERPSRRRLEELAAIWASQTGRKIVIA
jgi:hypothetical protein